MWWIAVMIKVPFIASERRWRGEEAVDDVGEYIHSRILVRHLRN
jgi:hypothetical protein